MKLIKTVWVLVLACSPSLSAAPMQTGLDRVPAHRTLFEGKRIGIIANHTACDSRGTHIVNVFKAMPGVNVVALFSPEHGLYGAADAGATIDSQVDPTFGLPVRSLYGQTRKPTPQMLRDIDVLVFDIQDIGARFYTYIYTMSLAMEAAAECGKAFVVLDRPNPINGLAVEGPILESQFATFVGLYPIPVRHGMTAGELARLFNGEGWLANAAQADLAVVPMEGWYRSMWYDQTGLSFRKPSPNMPDLQTATIYPGPCLLEGTNISEGRGTPRPFRQFGAPWLDAQTLATRLNQLDLPGLQFAPTSFIPTASKHAGQRCHGVSLIVTDRDRLEPFWTGVLIVNEVYRMDPEKFAWRQAHFDRLCGTAAIRQAISARQSLAPLRERWDAECQAFRKLRHRYLLYPPHVSRAAALGGNAISAILVRSDLTVPLSFGWTRFVRMIR
jgi:uncharacterized protein YbbC (DUF1343 family)